jgi:citrate lyase alpha subunit
MLYLGNYNLIEGNMNNVTSSQVLSDLDLLLSKNTDNIKVLTSNIPYNNDCSSMENINDDYLKSVKEVGGAEALGAESIRNVSQAKATACSTTVATNKL